MNDDQGKDLEMEDLDIDFWISVISILGCVFIIGFMAGATIGALS